MRRSYLDYAMSVIVARALPDVRDGLKPVHRRILYAMYESGYEPEKPFRKSARVVGDVMGKYHPHGDSAIYDAMVRMAQDFSMRLPLVDGQGNFGSMDGDPPAAMRYTEVRLKKSAMSLLNDIDKETVDFQPNYDDSTHEPMVLPALLPNLLVNGAGGIAVGMATNIPPHNLGEVIDACCAYIEDPAISIEQLMELVPGPDFPTGGEILGLGGIRDAYLSGKGSIVIRGKSHVEQLKNDREAIIISQVPYQVNKARMVERIAELARDKIIEGITEIRDESDREGVRVVIEVRRDISADVILSLLYKHSPLQTSFGINMLALHRGQPLLMNLKQVIAAFVEFREEVINRRSRFELRKAQERGHILLGLAVAVANIDEMIKIIRASADPILARQALMERSWPIDTALPLLQLLEQDMGNPISSIPTQADYRLTESQAKAILDLRLHRLTGLEREKIVAEMSELSIQISRLHDILNNRTLRLQLMKNELMQAKTTLASPRRTEITENDSDVDIEDLIQREDMVVTLTHNGYIKRVPLSAYRAQRRGGKGKSGMDVRDEDVVNQLFVINTHTPVLFFSNQGIVYKLKTYRLPPSTAQGRGKPLVQLLPLEKDEAIATLLPLPDQQETEKLSIIFATALGQVRRNKLADFVQVKSNGKIAIKLEANDRLVSVQVCYDHQDVFLATAAGKCIRFPVKTLRVFAGRNSDGVRGIKLQGDDRVISMTMLEHGAFSAEERESFLKSSRYSAEDMSESAASTSSTEEEEEIAAVDLDANVQNDQESLPTSLQTMAENEQLLLAVTERGYGKRTSSYAYRLTGRGGVGIANIETSERNGLVIASFPVDNNSHIMLVTNRGQVIRCPVHDIRISSRRTQGVKLFDVASDEQVVFVTCLTDEDDQDIIGNEDAPLEPLPS
ncbi:MAG: DNA gyrase subunit A [Rhodospirillaceae bacterium]|nr:DNA gyrase subunit A [Rhodospirillaceae bacterium]